MRRSKVSKNVGGAGNWQSPLEGILNPGAQASGIRSGHSLRQKGGPYDGGRARASPIGDDRGDVSRQKSWQVCVGARAIAG
mmetsp:Transcript_45214/g.120262  ORF Transcript_45214/g.120262 Transcript_45214/m.120262 type:complete len:81 (+) Transcript_45214:868-1110(+)